MTPPWRAPFPITTGLIRPHASVGVLAALQVSQPDLEGPFCRLAGIWAEKGDCRLDFITRPDAGEIATQHVQLAAGAVQPVLLCPTNRPRHLPAGVQSVAPGT